MRLVKTIFKSISSPLLVLLGNFFAIVHRKVAEGAEDYVFCFSLRRRKAKRPCQGGLFIAAAIILLLNLLISIIILVPYEL
jgi:hypothetical protein